MTKAKPTKKKKQAPAPSGFAPLQLSQQMMKALEQAGYLEPTPIQAGFIPLALEEHDVVAQARTGTGKTAAFAIPVIELLDLEAGDNLPQSLILAPTRELAVQVKNEVNKLSLGLPVRTVALYGGVPIRGQIAKLKQGADIVVGTPGRVLDHLSRGSLQLKNLDCVVLDEADRMLDIGFREDMEKILRRCPRERQTLLLSATIPPPIERMAQKYMQSPKKLNFSEDELAVETIEQFYFTVEGPRKFDLLVRLLKREQPRQAIVFARTKRGTERIYQRLSKQFEKVNCMHGDMQQRARDRVLSQFRDEKVKLLVATDVMGRGIDVSTVSHIINYDIPAFSDDYVHRVGRTGRMGREGVAYTFVTPEEGNELTRIEQRIDRQLKRDEIPGFVTVAEKRELPEDGQAEKRELPQSLVRGRPQRRTRRAL